MAPSIGKTGSGSRGIDLPPEEASRLAPGLLHGKKNGPSSGSDSSSGEIKITYGKPNATDGSRGDESRKARADYRAGTGGSSFQRGNPASVLGQVTGGRAASYQAKATPEGDKSKDGSGSPRDVKDHGK